jgi:hypothetical protein
MIGVFLASLRLGGWFRFRFLCHAASVRLKSGGVNSPLQIKANGGNYAIKLSFHLAVLFFAVCRAGATIDVSLQMQPGKRRAGRRIFQTSIRLAEWPRAV